jgi:hypothetical protein
MKMRIKVTPKFGGCQKRNFIPQIQGVTASHTTIVVALFSWVVLHVPINNMILSLTIIKQKYNWNMIIMKH